jgi:hypothetical protein
MSPTGLWASSSLSQGPRAAARQRGSVCRPSSIAWLSDSSQALVLQRRVGIPLVLPHRVKWVQLSSTTVPLCRGELAPGPRQT